jgi:phosphoribosylamine--glycine ligase
VSAGGRVLGVTATADTLEEAIKKAYKKVETVDFANGFYRHDIGARALAAKK